MKKVRTLNGQYSQLDRANWQRRYDKIQTLIVKVNDIADKITELEVSKMPILDEITIIRESLVAECVHPREYLIVEDEIYHCKFCNRKFAISK